jgi:hypothetical protein
MIRKNTKITMFKNNTRTKRNLKTQDHDDQKEHQKTSNKKEHKNISIQRNNKITMIKTNTKPQQLKWTPYT